MSAQSRLAETGSAAVTGGVRGRAARGAPGGGAGGSAALQRLALRGGPGARAALPIH